jgi:hypothetical protein
MQYIIRNNVHPSLLRELIFVELTNAHIVTELPVRISVTQFVSATQSNPQGAWLINDVMVNEVRYVHLQDLFPRSPKRRF